MALNITINKTAVVASYSAGSTVATAVASGGTTPYTYSIATGGDYFNIDSSTGVVTTKALMDAGSIQSFSVTATDSNSTPESITSGVMYPNIQASQQSKFNKSNVIYKIVNDIDLGNAVLTIPAGCTLDFQGGSFSNGTIVVNSTSIISSLYNILNNIYIIGNLNVDKVFPQWFGAKGDGVTDDTFSIQRAVNSVVNKGVLDLCSLSYKITKEILISNSTDFSIINGTLVQSTESEHIIHFTGYSSRVKFINLNLTHTYNTINAGNLVEISSTNFNFFEYDGGFLNKGYYGIRSHGNVWMAHFQRIWVLFPYSSGFYLPASGDVVNFEQLGGSTTTKLYKCFVTDVQTSNPAYAIGTGYDTLILDSCSADRCYCFGSFKANPLNIINCSSEEICNPPINPLTSSPHYFISLGSGTSGKINGFHAVFKSDFIPPIPPSGNYNSFLYSLYSNIEFSAMRGALPDGYYNITLEGGQAFGLTSLLGSGVRTIYGGVYYTPSSMVEHRLTGVTNQSGITKLWDFEEGSNTYILTFSWEYQTSFSSSTWLISTGFESKKGIAIKLNSGPDHPSALTVTVDNGTVNCSITGANLLSSWTALKIN